METENKNNNKGEMTLDKLAEITEQGFKDIKEEFKNEISKLREESDSYKKRLDNHRERLDNHKERLNNYGEMIKTIENKLGIARAAG